MGSVDEQSPVVRLVGIYRADGGLVGELRYLAGHYLRGQECSLCSVTHSAIRRRPAWDDAVAELGLPFDLKHRNELDARLAHYGEQAACIVAVHADGSSSLLMSDQEIEAVHGQIEPLFAVIRARLGAGAPAPAEQAG